MRDAEVWAILQIAETADIRAIKRAYATRLKEDRTHKDASRFIALREAYEQALQQAESFLALGDESSADAIGQSQISTQPDALEASDPEQPASTLQEPLDAAESPEEIELRPRAPRDDLPQLTPIPARPQGNEAERPPRPVDDTQVIAPLREDFQPLLAEMQLALKDEVDEAKFQALGQRVVAYLGRCDFVQREDAEHQLIQLFVRQHPEHNPLLRILDAEFGWSNDSLGFHQRFPFAPDDLLESLRPAQTQISEPYRRQLIAVLNGSLLAWPFISLFGIKTRRGLEQLLASSETLWEVSPTRLALWQGSFSLLPCISFTTYLLLTLFTAIQLHLLGVFSAAVETFLAAVFLPIAVWGGLRFAWRHTEAEYSNFSHYWPILASIFVLTPGVWHAITWSAGQLTSSPGYASTLFQALTIALTLAIGGFCAFRFANELQRVAATLSAHRMTFLTVLLALIGGVYLLPGAEELGFFGKTTLAGLTVMMLFSYMRQWQWRHGIAGVFFVPFIGLAGGALMALTGNNISHITRMCAFTINLVWLAESALRIPRLQSPAVPQKTGAFALAIVGLAATLSPASEAFHHALGFTALLGAECVAPLFSMRWQPGGKKGPELPAAGCLVIVIGLELISLILTARLPGNLSRAGDATTTVLGAMLLTRLLWTALSYQGWPFRKAHQ